MERSYQIIAEVKTQSPFGYESSNSWEYLFEIAQRVGDIISVHTDTRWGGSFDLVRKAKKLTKKPVLAKGIHTTDDDIRYCVDAGADKVLVVGRLPKVHLDACLIEPWDFDQIAKYPQDIPLVWNSRDLDTGGLKEDATIGDVRNVWEGWLCQASNIRTVGDVCEGVDAILVGQNLEQFADSLEVHTV